MKTYVAKVSDPIEARGAYKIYGHSDVR